MASSVTRNRGANLSTSNKCAKNIKTENLRIKRLRLGLARSTSSIKASKLLKQSNQKEKAALLSRLPILYPNGQILGGSRALLTDFKKLGFGTLNLVDLVEVLLDGGFEKRSGTEWVCDKIITSLPSIPSINPHQTLALKKPAAPKAPLHDFDKDEVHHLVKDGLITGLYNMTLNETVRVDHDTTIDCFKKLGPPPCGTTKDRGLTEYLYDFYRLVFNCHDTLIRIALRK